MAFPLSVRLYVAGVALAAVVAVAALFQLSSPSVDRPWLVAALAVVVAVESAFAVKVRKARGHEETRTHDEAFLVLAAFLLPPVAAFAAVAAGLAAAELIARRGFVKGGFNIAQSWLSVALALVVVDAVGGGGTDVTPLRVIAVLAGAAVFFVANRLLISGVFALAANKSFRGDLLDGIGAAVLFWTGSVSIGLLAGLTALAHPWSLPFAIAALAAVTVGFSGHALAERREQTLTDLVDWSWDGIFSVDYDGRIRLWNPTMEVLSGRDRAGAIGRPLTEILDLRDESGRSFGDFVAPATAPASPERRVFALESRDGTRWIRVSRSPLPDGGASFIARDITHERDAQRALEESEERLRLALRAGAMGWWEWDFGSNGFRISESLERIAGLEPGSFGGRYDDYVALIHPDDREAVAHTIARVVAGERHDLEHRIIRRDGTVRWVEAKGRTVAASGRPRGMIGVASDITERKRLESELLHSQKTEAVGQLAAGIAHDFNNLMSAVIGFSELVLMQLPTDDPLRVHVEQIAGAGERAAAMTQQLLAFSRKEEGVSPTAVDLNDVVTNMEKLLGRAVGDDVELVFDLEPHLGTAHADRGQIEQVLMNLAVNARDAMPTGGRITLRTANVEIAHARSPDGAVLSGSYVRLSVGDTGVGMDSETQARIFEPFFTTKAPGKGTGLGLANISAIVARSGGAIAVSSAPGEGTTFDIHLPRLDTPVAHDEHIVDERPRGGSETILLVEDAEGMRTLERVVLEEYGYTVLEADDVAHALELAEAHERQIDLLLTDVVMPRMSGPQLAEAIVQRSPETTVLYASGYSEDELDRHLPPEREVRLLVKPITPEVLARTVREALDAARADPSRPAPVA